MADTSSSTTKTARERAKDAGQDVDAAAGGAQPAGQKQARQTAAEIRASMTDEPLEVTTGDAVLVRGDDSVEDYVEDSSTSTYVVVKADVIEEFFYPDTKRPAHRIVYTKGQVVARADLEERLALIRAAGTAAGEGNPAGIDQTTLAAGTYPGVTEVVSQEQSPLGTSETK